MDQSQIAALARSAALRTVQSNIGNLGNCPSCVVSSFNGLGSCPSCIVPMLSGLGCDCEETGVAKCDACRKQMGDWKAEFGDWKAEFGDVSGSLWDVIKPALPWILLTGVVAGFAGWKMGNIYCSAKNKVSSAFGAKKKRRK
jgi:hypothetical protein